MRWRLLILARIPVVAAAVTIATAIPVTEALRRLWLLVLPRTPVGATVVTVAPAVLGPGAVRGRLLVLPRSPIVAAAIPVAAAVLLIGRPCIARVIALRVVKAGLIRPLA